MEADTPLAGNQPQDRQAQCRLARPGLPDDAQRLPLRQTEVDPVHRLDMVDSTPQQALLDREPDLELIDLQQRRTYRVVRRQPAGLGIDQHLRVGVLRRAEQGRAVRLLDNLPALHHAHAVGNAPHQVQVMADQQQRHAQACLQFLEQVENFQLHGHIQRRGRFVGNQQFRLVGQGHGDHHPLALPAGQLVGQGLEALAWLRDADHFQQLQGARSGLLAGQALVQQKDFIDLLFDAVQRVQRRHRLLEDHRNAVAANALQGFFVLLQQVLAFMADAAARVLGQGVGQQAQD